MVWKTLHPSWLEQFDLHLYDDQEQILEVTVWDKDKQTKDDFIGRYVKFTNNNKKYILFTRQINKK